MVLKFILVDRGCGNVLSCRESLSAGLTDVLRQVPSVVPAVLSARLAFNSDNDITDIRIGGPLQKHHDLQNVSLAGKQ